LQGDALLRGVQTNIRNILGDVASDLKFGNIVELRISTDESAHFQLDT
jgi:hypothetical protein